MSTTEKTRLSNIPLERAAILAPTHAPTAWAGAMHAHSARSMLPSWMAVWEVVAIAATRVAGTLTTMPTAAARPTLLCIGTPENVITTLVRMPPPTPAKPEHTPMPSHRNGKPTLTRRIDSRRRGCRLGINYGAWRHRRHHCRRWRGLNDALFLEATRS